MSSVLGFGLFGRLCLGIHVALELRDVIMELQHVLLTLAEVVT